MATRNNVNEYGNVSLQLSEMLCAMEKEGDNVSEEDRSMAKVQDVLLDVYDENTGRGKNEHEIAYNDSLAVPVEASMA